MIIERVQSLLALKFPEVPPECRQAFAERYGPELRELLEDELVRESRAFSRSVTSRANSA